MRSDGDDEALSWDGDDALEAQRPLRRPREPRRADAAAEEPAPADRPTMDPAPALPDPVAVPSGGADAENDREPGGLSTASLVALGILGGVYLLYTVGWILGGVGMQLPVTFTLPVLLYQGALWLAVLAPALWFAAVLVLTRGAKGWVRIVWLIAGAVLLVPWPFVVSGGGGVL
ncbi:DNA polymerase III subunit gamma/tau [Microbacterium sp. ARD32]|uniref:DNA polymerase III subunit gamma/tau n=1 Tax=Microbacterium sp. ARD32 TaxID=2962577 RepID=UPI0028811324|nr:DNA polymerase III subunit gamma/tau [Microbacterium sp. ARD32]MDT0156991.1 DNA polymerase III subunit gamma/tau [Microbacterium sp. ARD32]